tara:strand:+ start:1091 stop:2290 length:1200 start_codon:yes stop_codon:yes gene_type:complete
MAEETKKVEEPKVEETKVEKTKVKKTKNKDNITKVKIKEPEGNITKVDLSKPPTENEEVEKQPVEEEVVVVNAEPEVEPKEPAKEEQVEQPIVQEVTEEEVTKVKEEVEEAIVEAQETGRPLPEKVEKLISFMEETGGDLNDYVNLNRDIEKMDDSDVLDEYYRETKSHLTAEERNFLLEEKFGYNEDEDEERDVRRKKIALKEQVAEARAHLDRQKSKYYEDIKAGSKLTDEQQKAVDFFNRYNKESEERERLAEESKKSFKQKTESVFNENFKGFDYKVGDKKFRFNVKDADKVKETQSDLNNFINKFVGEDNATINDPQGYHKSLFTAMNADTIAKHFYEQGRADAIKDTVAKDKNIDTSPRQTHGETEVGGVKYRVLGESTADMKNRSFKIRKKN